MSDTPRWLAGWYATRLHAVDRPFHPASSVPIPAMCNADVYARPRTEWAERRLRNNPPKCKRCLKLLGQADAPSEVEQLRAEVACLRLTDAEREFLQRLQPSENPIGSYWTAISQEERKTVYALLARLGGER